MRGTVGQILINDALPPDLQDHSRILDKKGVRNLLKKVADNHPARYREILQHLMLLGRDAAYFTGSSFSLRDLRGSRTKRDVTGRLRRAIVGIAETPGLTDDEKDQKIVETMTKHLDELKKGTYEEGLAENNAFSKQVLSGSRGNTANLSSLRGADLLYLNHRDEAIPVPIFHNYSEGLDPVEYWSGTYGARHSEITKKMATADAGFFGKQLANATMHLLVTDEAPAPETGMPVDTDDDDNEGAVLAKDFGPYDAGTVLTPRILSDLEKRGIKRLLVHSPISAGGLGVPKAAAGIRERGGFSPIGDNIGIAAAQSLSEKLSQGQLSAKHSGGVVGSNQAASVSGFKAINQLVQIPKTFQNAATISDVDGVITKVEEAPQGGSYVFVNDKAHYVSDGLIAKVKKGDHVEQGDILSNGIPNPADIVKYHGIGEGRRHLAHAIRDAFRDSGLNAHRRNVELVARGLVNHVRITDPHGYEQWLPDDIVPYDTLAQSWKPRPGHRVASLAEAKQKYLEKPVLHYSIGTFMTPSKIKTLKDFGVNAVTVHDEPPPFEPEMVRAMDNLLYTNDWMAMMGGFKIKGGFLDAVARGQATSQHNQRPVPAYAQLTTFGDQLKTKARY